MFRKMVLAAFISLFFSLADGSAIKILSCDGGGVRGVSSLEILRQFEKDTRVSFHDDFDVFAGTSTGSIIAVALAIGVPIDEIMNDYVELSADVFSDKQSSLFKPKYSPDELERALTEILEAYGYTSKSTLSEIPKKVVIPTVRLCHPETGRWSMEIHENFTRKGGKVKIIDAVLESTAAPTYFPSHKNCVDGGVAMNDPSLAAFACAFHPLSIREKGCILLGIGTGYVPKYIKRNESWGVSQWMSPVPVRFHDGPTPLLNMILDVEGQVPEQLCNILMPNLYHKVNVPLTTEVALDDYEGMNALIEETQEFIQINSTYWHEACNWLSDAVAQ